MKTKFISVLLISLCSLLGFSAWASSSPSVANDFADEQGEVVQYDGKQYIRVTNARQFMRSIISGINVLVAKYTQINLTPLLDDETWWEKNLYSYKWMNWRDIQDLTGQNIVSEEVTDGRQLTIFGFNNIEILGEGFSSIVVEPRYAFCLNFVNCKNITLRNLTIGHTEDGNCTGGVIGVTGGSGISINDCNLYGCGAYGLYLHDTSDFQMCHSGIHDCTYGIMGLFNVESATFKQCNFFRNREYSLVIGENSNLSFDQCRFYANHPTSPLFEIDRPFCLSNSYILHPTESLGNIDKAVQKNNTFRTDPFEATCFGNDVDPFIGAGFGMEKIKVDFKGPKPTVLDFIDYACGNGDDEESDCDNWIKGLQRYLKTGKGNKNTTYVVDKRNGYVRIETKDSDGLVSFHDFCFWNCADGKHKLFAHSGGILDHGKAMETECTGLTFYSYDNDTRLLTCLGGDGAVLGERPSQNPEIAYLLPRVGKDLVYIDGAGKRGTLSWNGCGFGKVKANME